MHDPIFCLEALFPSSVSPNDPGTPTAAELALRGTPVLTDRYADVHDARIPCGKRLCVFRSHAQCSCRACAVRGSRQEAAPARHELPDRLPGLSVTGRIRVHQRRVEFVQCVTAMVYRRLRADRSVRRVPQQGRHVQPRLRRYPECSQRQLRAIDLPR